MISIDPFISDHRFSSIGQVGCKFLTRLGSVFNWSDDKVYKAYELAGECPVDYTEFVLKK